MSSSIKYTGENYGSIRAVQIVKSSMIIKVPIAIDGVVSSHIETKNGESDFHSIYFSEESGSFNFKGKNTIHGVLFTSNIKLKHPKVRSSVISHLDEFLREKVVVIVFDTNGQAWLLGTKQTPLTLSYSGNLGVKMDNFNHVQIDISGKTKKSPAQYTAFVDFNQEINKIFSQGFSDGFYN